MPPEPFFPELEAWARARLPECPDGVQTRLTPLAGDASSRRYFRLEAGEASYIVAEAPPATEKNESFIAVQEQLSQAGVRVPAIVAADTARGYLLLEDLGDRLLLAELSRDNADGHYRRAGEVLLLLASSAPDPSVLPSYDETLLAEEADSFRQWFVQELLGYDIDREGNHCLEALCRLLIDSALQQPRVLVHRDFHSRNLMLQDNGELAVIDFQDAVIGPVTYDLVSLPKDCYLRWPVDRVRHLKVLGTFARLYLRDGKADYLQDLPLVVRYVREALEAYAADEPEFSAFSEWFDTAVAPRIDSQPWSAAG